MAAVLGTALHYMSDDMLNLAIPSLARDLGATVTDAQWILNAYYVALVSCVLVAGSVGDIFGHPRVFVGGVVVFSVGAVGCALAQVVGLLVLGRFVQGIGAAMLLTAGLALVSKLNAPEERGRASASSSVWWQPSLPSALFSLVRSSTCSPGVGCLWCRWWYWR